MPTVNVNDLAEVKKRPALLVDVAMTLIKTAVALIKTIAITIMLVVVVGFVIISMI